MTGKQLGHTRKNFSLTTKHFTLLLLLLLLVLLLLLTFSFCRHSCHCSFCLLLHPQRNGRRWNQLQHLRIATAAIVLLHLLIASRLHQGCSKVIAVLLHRNKPRNVGCFAIVLLQFETHRHITFGCLVRSRWYYVPWLAESGHEINSRGRDYVCEH